jgi:hypothetical protein
VKRTGFLIGLSVCAATAMPARAQVMWDSPMLLAPNSPGGLGIFLVEPQGPELPAALGIDDDGFGVVGTWRASSAPGVGFRVGLSKDPFDNLSVLAGLDLSGTLLTPTEEVPVGFIWFTGAGIGVGDEVLATFPVGISAGIDVTTEGILFRPYLAPRLDLNIWSGPGDEADLSIAVELGLDLAFTSDWLIRFAGSVGDGEAIAIGLHFPGVSLE